MCLAAKTQTAMYVFYRADPQDYLLEKQGNEKHMGNKNSNINDVTFERRSKIIDEIEFHVQTSKMVMNKGKPVVNQVPNFSKVMDDEKWRIISARISSEEKQLRHQE